MYVKVYITTHRQQRVHTDHSHWQTGEVALTRFRPAFRDSEALDFRAASESFATVGRVEARAIKWL